MSAKIYDPAFPDHDVVRRLDVGDEVRSKEALLETGALQSAIFNSANFSSIATDAKGRHSDLQCRRGTHAGLRSRRCDEQYYPGRHF